MNTFLVERINLGEKGRHRLSQISDYFISESFVSKISK